MVVEVEVPADLLAAIELDFHGFALTPGATPTPSTLAEAFGEELEEKPEGSGSWKGERIFFNKADDNAELPYLVVTGIDGPASYESPDSGPSAAGEVLMVPFATTRSQAVSLATLTVAFFNNRPLRFANGSVALIRCTNPFGPAVRDPGKWTGGDWAWGAPRRFRVLMG